MRLILVVMVVAPLLAELTLLEQQLARISEVRSIYVDELAGDGGVHLRDMVIGSIQRSGVFALTEDESKADAFLRGSAEDLIFTDYASVRRGLNVRGAASNSQRNSGESDYQSTSFGVGETDSTQRRERKHDASAALRLVLKGGEVIWSTTRQSLGAKYKSSAADVADLVARDLGLAHKRAQELNRGLPKR